MDPVKPGKYTSEFLAVGALLALIIFRDKLGLELSPADVREMVWAIIAYITGRSGVKMAGSVADIIKTLRPPAPPPPSPERRTPDAT